MRKALGGGVGAVGGGEGIVDVDVAELGELFDIGRIVLLLALVEARVLEQQNVAVLHCPDRVGGHFANAVADEADRPADDLSDRLGDRSQRIGFVRTALRAAEMREQNDLAALVGDLLYRLRHALDARLVGDAAVFDRTFRSTRRRTRFPETSASSSVRNGLVINVPPSESKDDARSGAPCGHKSDDQHPPGGKHGHLPRSSANSTAISGRRPASSPSTGSRLSSARAFQDLLHSVNSLFQRRPAGPPPEPGPTTR